MEFKSGAIAHRRLIVSELTISGGKRVSGLKVSMCEKVMVGFSSSDAMTDC